MKTCAMCKQSLPLDAFHKNRARHDGLDTRCKPCGAKHRREQYHRHPERERAKRAAFVEANRGRMRPYWREKARQRRQTASYQTYYRPYIALWLKTPKGRANNQAKRRRRRAKELHAPGRHTREQLAGRIALYWGRCWICGAPATAVDHVKPLTKGGSEWPANLRPICKPCNSTKNDTWPYPRRPHF
jgi:5-methylcytosine-specific restriction endonuclease McrA